jgi:hypothetical protein
MLPLRITQVRAGPSASDRNTRQERAIAAAMNTRAVASLVASLTASACFYDGSPTPPPRKAQLEGALVVRDLGGAAYDVHGAPRDALLSVAAPRDALGTLDEALLLVRGRFEGDLAARLAHARRSTSLLARSVPVQVEQAAHELRVRPAQALEPGTPYTLLWLLDEAAAQTFPFAVSADPALGARWVESWPSHEASVATHVARALLRFDGYVAADLPSHVHLLDEAGTTLASQVEPFRCQALGLPAGDCAWVTPAAALPRGTRYTLSLDAGLRTLTGATVAPQRASFAVSSELDTSAPRFLEPRCALDEQRVDALCMRVEREHWVVRGNLDQSALITLTALSDGAARSTAGLSHANGFELQLAASNLRALSVRAENLAGQARDLSLTIDPPPALPALVIDEVMADPRGKEPAQEWIELLNSDLTPVSLMGFSLSTDESERGRAITLPVVLAPSERVLLVGPEFDARDVSDGDLPASLRRVPLAGSLSLANAGGVLMLRDAGGRRVAAARYPAALFEGQCSAMLLAEAPAPADRATADAQLRALRVLATRERELDPRGGCTPGRATLKSP